MGRMLWFDPPLVMGRLRDVPGRGASAVALSSMRSSAAPFEEDIPNRGEDGQRSVNKQCSILAKYCIRSLGTNISHVYIGL